MHRCTLRVSNRKFDWRTRDPRNRLVTTKTPSDRLSPPPGWCHEDLFPTLPSFFGPETMVLSQEGSRDKVLHKSLGDKGGSFRRKDMNAPGLTLVSFPVSPLRPLSRNSNESFRRTVVLAVGQYDGCCFS